MLAWRLQTPWQRHEDRQLPRPAASSQFGGGLLRVCSPFLIGWDDGIVDYSSRREHLMLKTQSKIIHQMI